MSTYNRPQPTPNPVARWFAHASAVFAGSLLAGLVLLACARFYVHYSLESWAEKLKHKTVDTRR